MSAARTPQEEEEGELPTPIERGDIVHPALAPLLAESRAVLAPSCCPARLGNLAHSQRM